MANPAGQRWSRERPKEPGWYWIRWNGNPYDCAKIVEDRGTLCIDDVGRDCEPEPLSSYSDPKWEWQGPITPHDQEAG